jgi:hypothetical protein
MCVRVYVHMKRHHGNLGTFMDIQMNHWVA